MRIGEIQHAPGAVHRRKRLGKGASSGKGGTCGKGHKGQKARTGHHGVPRWFEGGQMPLQRRAPKRGMRSLEPETDQVVNLGALARFAAGSVVGAAELAGAGLVKSAACPVKLLANGELPHALTVRVDRASAAAVKKLEAAGGKFEPVAATAK
ncbi:MAG TPA: 50S ribosomal protein L15 [Candidatus Saccharimonadales bacterium]|nr:50S ribosomal protein L15 [Candidatus Saccharimonadales bacterium]